MNRYEGKRVLVTGGGLGIGRAIARRLASEGAAVAILDLNAENLAGTKQLLEDAGARVEAFEVDVGDMKGVTDTLAKVEKALGGLDLLVLIGWPGAMETMAQSRLPPIPSSFTKSTR